MGTGRTSRLTAMARPMTTEALTLFQWLSPAFPVGAFAYSHGLEAAIAEARVADAAALRDWLADVLAHGAGRVDAALIACAYEAEPDAVAAIDQQARALAPSRERLLETEAQGAAFGRVVGDVWGMDLSDLCLPVALGAAARAEGLDLRLTQEAYLQAFVSNLIQAALRLMPLGQTEGQRILRDLTGLIRQTARTAEPDDLASTAFLSDISAMRHETQEPRIFRT